MNEQSLICGIDFSLRSSGICLIDMKGRVVYCESINPYTLNDSARLNYVYQRYVALFQSFSDIHIIGFERQVSQQRYNKNAKYILSLAEGFGVLKLAMYSLSQHRQLEVYQFTAQDLKIYATNNGKATKEDMIESLPKRVKSTILSYSFPPGALDDVVDAYYAAMRTKSLLESEENPDKYIYLLTRKENPDYAITT